MARGRPALLAVYRLASDRQQEAQEKSKPWQSKTTGHKRSRPLSDSKTVIVM